jgi:choline dehydrogenase-like flavoprotein
VTDEIFDYVIVGSGAAGASAARVLCETGRSIAIVEEGPSVSTADFVDRALPTFSRLYRERGAQVTTGLPSTLVIQGSCVGGSTVVNSGIIRRLPAEVWQGWVTDHGLDRRLSLAEIDDQSGKIEEELSVAPTDDAIAGGNNQLLAGAAARRGLAGSPTRRNTPGCRGSARCNLGCPHGAKQSMQLSYLPYAIERGATLFADERVEQITSSSGRASGVRTVKRTLGARRAVIVAASAVQTPSLLARSGLRSRHLGRHFQGHPGMAIVGLFDHSVRMGEGATQGFEIDGLRSAARVKIETLAVPPETFLAGMPGIGAEWVGLLAEFDRAAVWVLPLRARAEGTVAPDGSRQKISYRVGADDVAYLKAGLRLGVEMMFEAGAHEVVTGVYGIPERLRPGQAALISEAPADADAYPLAMSHLFGTARMSARSADGVVDLDFRVHDVENVYVVDSSVFPTNLGVNPQLAIMAMARIAAQRLAA